MNEQFLRIMIIDDEQNVRNLLKVCLDWNEIGMEIVGEASSGREALDLLDTISPDIIFTDIFMPFMDGLEFSRLTMEQYPQIKIVILTAHEEFDFAKKGIKLGVADYILKPISKAEIKKVALKLKEKIEAQRLHNKEVEELKIQLEENLPYLKERFLNDLLIKSLEHDEILKKISFFKLRFNTGFFQVALMETSPADAQIEVGEETKLLLRLQCLDLAKQYFQQGDLIYSFFDNSQKIAILNTDEKIQLSECCEQLKDMLINRLKCFVSIGVGNVYSSIESICFSYKEASLALNQRIIWGKNIVINFSDINLSQEGQFEFRNEKIADLELMILAGLSDKVDELVDSFFEADNLGRNVSIETLRIAFSNYISCILNVINKAQLKIADIFANNIQPYDQIYKIDTLPEMKSYVKDTLHKTINKVKAQQTKKVNKTIKTIEEFISENISNNELSLSMIANRFYLNPSYLSRIFKQETGKAFIEYLTEFRIEMAVRLLKETDLKIYQIAERVGINDPNYLSLCFKKHTGMSMIEYKKANI